MKSNTLEVKAATPKQEFSPPFGRATAWLDGVAESDLRWLMAVPADIVLLIDGDGVVRDSAALEDSDLRDAANGWIGAPWGDVVAVESRDRIDSLLRGSRPQPSADVVGERSPSWRHLNFIGPQGQDVPMSVCSVRVGSPAPSAPGGALRVVAFCRDMRPLAAMQQRLVEAQHAVERDYLRFRHAETRYRHLFGVSSEGMLVLDATTLRVLEANPAAEVLLSSGEAALPSAGGSPHPQLHKLVGASFPVGFSPLSHDAVTTVLAMARGAGRAEETRCDLASGVEVVLSASMFRQDSEAFFLVRLSRVNQSVGAAELLTANAMLLKLAQSAPDCLVVTDLDGRVLSANAAFVDLVQLATEEQVRGESLERWLGRTGVDLNVLISNLRQRGSVRLFATTVRGAYGVSTEVEISAALVPHGSDAFLGFTIRDVSRRLLADSHTRRELPRSVGQLTELVGRVPLKDIVGETSDLIEQLCIEAALELTRDNRASAAEMLGLSRQSLYVKLRRYGLGDLGGDSEVSRSSSSQQE
jgi:transcriptional regulator PpsR